jgi:N-acetylglucosaminyl-diphospho-decaprenol L-rhamnosyltransferase
MTDPGTSILVSVVIVNYNGKVWVQRCMESLRAQTIYDRIEVIFTDNISSDGSDLQAQELMNGWPHGVFLQTGANLGFGGGANRGAALAKGKFLFFLNPDVWLESDCLERLATAADENGYDVAGPTVLNYNDNSFQSKGVAGFDIFGLPINPGADEHASRWCCPCSFFFIRRDLFQKIGGWDDYFFMYGEEMDLAWRVSISGATIGAVPAAIMHHRGEAADSARSVEFRSSDSKRFYTHRNHLLTLLKSPQHILLLLLLNSIVLALLEGLLGAALLRRWSFFSNTTGKAVVSCWQMRGHWLAERRRINGFRKRGDFWMMRFLTWRLNRWSEVRQLLKFGVPKMEKR